VPVLGLALSLLIGVSLGFFGGGGSILTVPLLVYVFGLDAKTAIASSLLIVGAASFSGAFQHWRAGHVELRTGLLFGAAGMAGAYVGGRAGAFFDGALLLLLFAAMMIFTATAMWRGRREPASPAPAEQATGHLLAQGLGVGLVTGLVGAGGGFLIVPALALWAGLPMPVAVGTSLQIIVLNCLAGFAGYLAHVAVDPRLVAAVGTAAIAGSFVGSRLAHRVDPASLRRAFAGFVAVMAAVILVREADAWVDTARQALPATVPQIVFALVVLAIGIAAGRVTRRGGSDPLADRTFSQGAGI
jgi:uncharacterized membrane protein YfcA